MQQRFGTGSARGMGRWGSYPLRQNLKVEGAGGHRAFPLVTRAASSPQPQFCDHQRGPCGHPRAPHGPVGQNQCPRKELAPHCEDKAGGEGFRAVLWGSECWHPITWAPCEGQAVAPLQTAWHAAPVPSIILASRGQAGVPSGSLLG